MLPLLVLTAWSGTIKIKLEPLSPTSTSNPFLSCVYEPKLFNVAKKVTKAESHLRRQAIYGYLSEGLSRGQILQNCSSWNICDRQVDTYIQQARQMLEEDCAMTRQAFLAEVLHRLRNYEQQAAQRGQFQVAVNSATTQAKLIGLTD